jgi:hypothetical protein
MHRALIKIMVSLALAMGLALAVGPTVGADAATRTTHATVTRATTPAACANQQAWVNSARHQVAKAKRALRNAEHSRHHHAAKVRAAKKHLAQAKHRLARARHARDTCVRNHPSQPPVTTASPIQALCDAGVPQPVCDGLAGLIPSGSTSLPIAQLCSAVPNAQPLCDAINSASSGGLPDVSSLQSVLTTVLNAVGLGDLLNTVGLGDLTGLLGNLI